jgi:hypothetical protein
MVGAVNSLIILAYTALMKVDFGFHTQCTDNHEGAAHCKVAMPRQGEVWNEHGWVSSLDLVQSHIWLWN